MPEPMNGLEWSYEMFWAGYLKFLFNHGMVTIATPEAEILRIKAEFMAGIRGEYQQCATSPVGSDNDA